ncbi:MAG TPA: hypothetical protein VI758_14110 [Bacteroidota bacterium]
MEQQVKVMKYFLAPFLVFLLVCPITLHGQTQYPPSQRELNGFLLGQDERDIAGWFGTLIKEQKYSDGWTDRAYALDSTSSSFMVFGFPDSVDDCYSIQISGKPGTAMRPFLGLKLGDPREKVIAMLGTPSRVQHLQQPYLEFLQFRGRNYTVELDSLGHLWSIRILGYNGYPANPADSLPDVAEIFSALKSKDPSRILDVLAPDVELNDGDSQLTFSGAAASEIEDPASPMSQLLYTGPSSLATISDSAVKAAALDPQSIAANKLSPMFRFPQPSPVSDIVFVVHAGKWRIWEAHLTR